MSEEQANQTDQTEETEGDSQQENRQDIFDREFNALVNTLGESCEKNQIDDAIMIMAMPGERPKMWSRQDLLQTASLLAAVLKDLKISIYEMVDSDPSNFNSSKQ